MLECEDELVEGTKRYLKEFIGNVLGKKELEEEEKLLLVKEKHEESHAGVSGIVRKLFCADYYWPSMRRMVIMVCQGCVVCLKYNHGRIGFHLITSVTSALPIDIIGMDFICGLPESNEGYTIVLIVIDIASCFMILCKLIFKEVGSVAEALLSVFANFGVLKEIQSDQDPLFFNKVMEAFCNALTAKSRKVMRYYPAQNGAVERYVREVLGLVVKLLKENMTNWVKFLLVVQMSLNDHYILRYKSTPFVVMFARERNQAANYEGLELKVATPEKLLERNQKMVYSVYPVLAKLSKEAGKKGCDDANEMRWKKRSLQPKPLVIGTSVMKEVDKKTTKWQQP